jgi:hypothetical protein
MIPKLYVKWYAASIPKSCNSADENEDAYSPQLSSGTIQSGDFFQCAISDGATRSSFAGVFARSIVETCSGSRKNEPLNEVLRRSRLQWNTTVKSYDLPWHAQEKLREGAFATLVWLQFFPRGTGNILWNNYWRGIAIGDSCLFQYRKDTAVKKLPVKHSSEFNNHPMLISSRPNANLVGEDWEITGSWESGDDFFLATDALAKWAYHAIETNKNPATIFKDRLTRKARDNHFAEWITQMRQRGEIKDDDTTLIWIKLG